MTLLERFEAGLATSFAYLFYESYDNKIAYCCDLDYCYCYSEFCCAANALAVMPRLGLLCY